MGVDSAAKLEFTKEAQTAVNILTDHKERMLLSEKMFIEDLEDRFERFGDETWISEKQIAWLRRLVDYYG